MKSTKYSMGDFPFASRFDADFGRFLFYFLFYFLYLNANAAKKSSYIL